jgi:hypothetical protein
MYARRRIDKALHLYQGQERVAGYNLQLYTMLSRQLIHMSGSETQANNAEETKKDEAVLSQIGEDPGLSPETVEQDSKAMDHKENRQGKDIDRTKTKD